MLMFLCKNKNTVLYLIFMCMSVAVLHLVNYKVLHISLLLTKKIVTLYFIQVFSTQDLGMGHDVGLGQISKVAKNKVKFMYSTFF